MPFTLSIVCVLKNRNMPSNCLYIIFLRIKLQSGRNLLIGGKKARTPRIDVWIYYFSFKFWTPIVVADPRGLSKTHPCPNSHFHVVFGKKIARWVGPPPTWVILDLPLNCQQIWKTMFGFWTVVKLELWGCRPVNLTELICFKAQQLKLDVELAVKGLSIVTDLLCWSDAWLILCYTLLSVHYTFLGCKA